MCNSRNWKQIETLIFDETAILVATRSDNLVIKVPVTFESRSTSHKMVKKVSDGMKKLETFRNCKCLPEAPCEKHQIKEEEN